MHKRAHSSYAVLRKECKRVTTVADVLTKKLTHIVKSFPSHNSVFYQELMKATIDVQQFESSLQSVRNLIDDITKIKAFTIKRIETASDLDRLRRAFYGRISALVQKSNKTFAHLDHVRYVMRRYPIIKDLPTVAIVGFPNVGKTTLLSKLTTSKAEIAPYAFTTKNINCGYLIDGSKTIQLLDTPGTLARPEKMNAIEKQAYCAMRHCAQVMVYIFDPTDTYELDKQELLLVRVTEIGKKVILYMSKTDIAEKEKILAIQKKYPDIIVSADTLKDKLQLACFNDAAMAG